MADINAIKEKSGAENEGAVVPIFDKLDNPYNASFTVLGSESKKYRGEQDKVTREAIQNRRHKLTPEEITDRRIRLASSAVVAWEGWESEGKALECTPENVRSLLGVPHILEQVEEGIEKHARFFGKPSTNS